MNRISEIAYRVISTMIQLWKTYFDGKRRVYCILNRNSILYNACFKREIDEKEWWRKDENVDTL